MTDEDLFRVLTEAGCFPRRCGSNIAARCPAHDDRRPSLSARVSETGRVLLHCHAGCSFAAVAAALGLLGAAPGARPAQPQAPPPRPFEGWGSIIPDTDGRLERAEAGLGLAPGSLRRIGAVWAAGIGALAAPMWDHPGGSVIGVRLRAEDGRKWAVKGSCNGLFCAVGEDDGPIWMPEGMTDSAAIAGLGLPVIGRPSAAGGVALARTALAWRGCREAVILGDRDEAGLVGARALASALTKDGVRCRIVVPPAKDAREWVRRGASRGDFEGLTRFAPLV